MYMLNYKLAFGSYPCCATREGRQTSRKKFKSSFNQVWGALHSMGQNFMGDISEKHHRL